jgi:hypothetical protein
MIRIFTEMDYLQESCGDHEDSRDRRKGFQDLSEMLKIKRSKGIKDSRGQEIC